MSPNILIIEDEAAIRDMLRFSFANEPFNLIEAADITQAKAELIKSIPDLILLDWMLPELSGIDFIAWLKQQEPYQEIPIIMLTAKAEEENKITGLTAGADDYVSKPFSPRELAARIKAVLRRRSAIVSPKDQIKFKSLIVDAACNEVSVNGKPILMTVTEYKLLLCLLKNPNRTLSRDQLITKVWGPSEYVDERTVDVAMKRLRAKLKPFQYEDIIKTVRGVGYQFNKGHNK